jgi:hypothetical protein
MTMAERQRWVLALTSTASLMISLDALVVTTARTRSRWIYMPPLPIWNGP